jgi:hypothetical protein
MGLRIPPSNRTILLPQPSSDLYWQNLARRVRASHDGEALLLEDPERTSPHGDEVLLRVVHLRLGGRRPAGAVGDPTLAGYASLNYSP